MRSFAKLGLALSAAGLAAAAPAAIDSPATPAATTMTAPAAPAGGWTGNGWNDTARVPIPAGSVPAPAQADTARAPVLADTARRDPPPAPEWRETGARSDDAPRVGWRRQTWDGGRGPGFRYRFGERLPNAFAAPDYAVHDWQAYDLPAPGRDRIWVRYYDDAVLVDAYGIVTYAVPAVAWDRPRRPDPAIGVYYQAQAQPAQVGPVSWGPGECSGGGQQIRTCVYHGSDGSTKTETTSPDVVTTKTTEQYVAAKPRRRR